MSLNRELPSDTLVATAKRLLTNQDPSAYAVKAIVLVTAGRLLVSAATHPDDPARKEVAAVFGGEPLNERKIAERIIPPQPR